MSGNSECKAMSTPVLRECRTKKSSGRAGSREFGPQGEVSLTWLLEVTSKPLDRSVFVNHGGSHRPLLIVYAKGWLMLGPWIVSAHKMT